MADIVFNVSKGRVAEFHERVNNNDPTNSALIVVPVDVGATTDATIRDFDTLAAVLAGGVTERTTGGWSRKTLTDADLAAITTNDTDDRNQAAIIAQTWTGVSSGTVTDLIICYDPDTTGGADSAIIPLTMHDFAITPDGSDVTVNAGDYFRAS